MSQTQNYITNTAIHPGETLLENIEFLNISQKDLADRMGITEKHVSNIINGKASITPETAIKLEKVVGGSASFWNNLEKGYNLDLARIAENKNLEKDFSIIGEFRETYKELAANNLIENKTWIDKNLHEIVYNLQKFFGVDSLSSVQKINNVAFRRYDRNSINHNTVAAMIRAGELVSRKIDTGIYNKNLLEESLKDIKELSKGLSYDKYIPKIVDILAQTGVALVCLPGFKNTHIQGASKWLSPNKAMIILKTTKQGEDKFWFNLFHEIGHILKHGKKKVFIDFEKYFESDIEKEADKFANDILLPNFSEKDLIVSNSNKIYVEETINYCAEKFKISKSIIAGRLSHDYKNSSGVYRIMSQYIGRIDYNVLK